MGKRIYVRRPIAERVWEKVALAGPDECWEWQASRNPKGYGSFGGSRDEVRGHAHRIVWTLTHGPIPEGLFVLHRCDNPPCCNPAHLFLGTAADNTADMVAKGRARRGPMWPYPDEVYAAMRMERSRGLSYREIGRRFGVTHPTVRRACERASLDVSGESDPRP